MIRSDIPMNAGSARLLLAALALVALVATGCSSDDDGGGITPPPDENPTATELTQQGWTAFAGGDFATAEARFGDAIAEDTTYGPAYTGLGWTRLSLATSPAAMIAAASNFDAAAARGQQGADVLGGRAAAQLGAGGAQLPGAVDDAQAALAADANFVFSHRVTFTHVDLRLIEAFALLAQGDVAGALAAADEVAASGIEAGDAGTWEVDGVTYSSFAGAVLAQLARLSDQYAG